MVLNIRKGEAGNGGGIAAFRHGDAGRSAIFDSSAALACGQASALTGMHVDLCATFRAVGTRIYAGVAQLGACVDEAYGQ